MARKIPHAFSQLLPFELVQSSVSAVNMPISEGNHTHHAIEVIYLVNGSASVTINQETKRIKSHQLLLILANNQHAVFKHIMNARGLYFSFKTLPMYPAIEFESEEGFLIYHDRLADFQPYVELLLQSDVDSLAGKYLFNSFIYKVLDCFQLDDFSRQAIDSSPKIEQIKEQLGFYYTDTVHLEDLAKLVNLSPSYLSRLFHKETGETITEYIRGLRLKHACSLLKETNLTINEIARETGFQSSHNFSQQFSKQFGQTPNQFRKQ